MSSVEEPLAHAAGSAALSAATGTPRRVLIVGSIVAAVLLLAIAWGLAWRKTSAERAAADNARAAGQVSSARAGAKVDALTKGVPARVAGIADALAAGTLVSANIAAQLADTLGSDDLVTGYGVAFDRGVLPGSRLLAPYVERSGGRGEPPLETDLGELYDYTEFRYGWFRNALLDGAGWTEANLFPDTGDQVALYVKPFSLPGAGTRTSGIVFAVFSLDVLTTTLGDLTGAGGYSYLVSHNGQYLVHPRQDLVLSHGSVFATAWEGGNQELHRLAVDALAGRTADAKSTDPVTGRVTWTFVQPVPTTGWSVFTVLFGDRIAPNSNTERRQTFQIVTCAMAGSWLLALAAIAYFVRDSESFHWSWSLSLTIVLCVGIGALWMMADRFPPSISEVRTVVLDEATAHQFVSETDAGATATKIPTGVFIRSINIDSAAEVMVSGFVWQRFEIGRQDNVPRGFMLPETFDPGRSEINEVFKQKSDGEEFIGWEFKAAFRQHFDYGTYPFDRQSAWVRLRPPSLATNVVFIPDYSGYQMMDPAFRPGVDSAIVLPGWDIIGSYFDYRMHSHNASLGLPGREGEIEYPELYFNVEMRRRFLGPFVTHIVPGIVTAAMLFLLLLISSRREASEGMLGFSAAEIVLGAAALFFVASFQHTALRESLMADTVLYFEYFYFGLYLLIMLVSVNAILFASALHVRIIEYHDNLIPKLAFWPACMVVAFLLTFIRFY
jgi:hypothetical protein